MRDSDITSDIASLTASRTVQGYGFALCAVVVLCATAINTMPLLFAFPSASIILTAITVLTVVAGLAVPYEFRHKSAVLLGLASLLAALALILLALTGGHGSPLWPVLLVASAAAALVLPSRYALVLVAAIWLAAGIFVLVAPPSSMASALIQWLALVATLGLVGVLQARSSRATSAVRVQALRRERMLHNLLQLSDHMRADTPIADVLASIAQAAHTCGDFDCVSVSRVYDNEQCTVAIALGASGRRLRAVEGLTLPWRDFAVLMQPPQRVGREAYRSISLPFRTIADEHHLLLPISIHDTAPHCLLTVSSNQNDADDLYMALPLLELLVRLASAHLSDAQLYTGMEQRIASASTEVKLSREAVAQARDRAETLYHISRTLASVVEERQALSQGLPLLLPALMADCAGVMMPEPTSGRLELRASYEAKPGTTISGLEQGRELAGVVLANGQPAYVDDANIDVRWLASSGTSLCRSVLLVPLLLDQKPIGVLLVGRHQAAAFDESNTHLALTAASQIAVAHARAQLYRQTNEQNDHLSLLLDQRDEEVRKVQAILGSIGEGVVMSDRLGRIRLINAAAEHLLDIRAELFLGRRLAELPGPDAYNGVPAQFSLGNRVIQANHAMVRATNNEGLGEVIVYHDITREALTDKLKSEFIANASHELRTPLTSIRGYIDLLLLGTLGPLSHTQADFLKVVKNNVGRLVELIDDLLDVSRVEAGEVRLRREPVDVAEILYEVGEALYTQFTERSISLAIDIQEDLPPVVADRQRLRQIIINLVGNACKYTPSGGHVDVVLHRVDDEVRIDIRDTGVGIAEAARTHIFTPFFRADNPLRDSVGGTGLGLSITKSLVDLHGGRIWFESSEGEGTTFSFTLPLYNTEWTPVEWLAH